MLTDEDYDDGWSRNAPRFIGGMGHVVYTTRSWLTKDGDTHQRAYCVVCVDWVGPPRDSDPNSLRLVEDDAIAHFHNPAIWSPGCDVRPGGFGCEQCAGYPG